MGQLSDKNQATAREHARRIECLLIEADYTVVKTMPLDLGGRIGLIIENPDAVHYSQEQVRSGEAYELEDLREPATSALEAINGRLA